MVLGRDSGKSQIPGKFRGLLHSKDFLVMLEGEPLLTHPSLGAGQSVDDHPMVTHPLDEFHLLIQEMVLQEVTEMRVCADRTQNIQSKRACLDQVLLQGQGDFRYQFYSAILGRLQHVLEDIVATVLALQL